SVNVVNAWEESFWSEKVKISEYGFDAQQLRAYFPYKKVKLGIFNVISRMFGVSFRQVRNTPVWADSVECWEMTEHEKLLGRFYLDMHPRPNKYSHGAHFPIRMGVAGRQIPESALVCPVLPFGMESKHGVAVHQNHTQKFLLFRTK